MNPGTPYGYNYEPLAVYYQELVTKIEFNVFEPPSTFKLRDLEFEFQKPGFSYTQREYVDY